MRATIHSNAVAPWVCHVLNSAFEYSHTDLGLKVHLYETRYAHMHFQICAITFVCMHLCTHNHLEKWTFMQYANYSFISIDGNPGRTFGSGTLGTADGFLSQTGAGNPSRAGCPTQILGLVGSRAPIASGSTGPHIPRVSHIRGRKIQQWHKARGDQGRTLQPFNGRCIPAWTLAT